MTKRILFIGSSDVGARYSAQAAIALGYEPFFLCPLAGYQGDTKAQILEYPHLDCEVLDPGSILDALSRHKIDGVEGVISLLDTQLKLSAELSRRLGAKGVDPEIDRLKNKAYVAELIPEFSPATVRFRRAEDARAELARLFASAERAIVKPAEGAGALGAFYLRREEWDRLPSKLDRDGEWIAQAAVKGELFSAEGYCAGSKPVLLGFSNRRRVSFTESGATFPADRFIPEKFKARAVQAVETLVARSGFSRGYFHVEFIFNDAECSLIDANMGRVGGGPIAELLAFSYAVAPARIFQHVLDVGLFGRDADNPYPAGRTRRGTSAVLYGLERGGVVDDVILPSGHPCRHTRLIENGGRVEPMGKSDWSWVGILSGRTDDTLETIKKMRIVSSGRELTPFY